MPNEINEYIYNCLPYKTQCLLRTTTKQLCFAKQDFFLTSEWKYFRLQVPVVFERCHELFVCQTIHDCSTMTNLYMLFEDLPMEGKKRAWKDMKIMLQVISIFLRGNDNFCV